MKRIESPYAVVLTGTPLENRLEELLSIVQYVDRHRLGPAWRLRHDHQALDEAGRVIGYRDLDRIGQTLEPVLLRRRKSDVLSQLPPRVDNTVFVAMTDEQMNHHEENRAIVDRIVSRWRKTGYLSDADQRRLTCALQNMRMSCNSTYLLDGRTDHGAKADELTTLLAELFERPEAKAVVFSQWLGTHELVVRRLKKNGWDYVLFHGGVPSDKRGALVDRFRQDPTCRVFLSTDAGGLGLNLQHAASTVINMDLPWNPAVLEQRIGRVYRLGQQRSVQVVNFVAEGTIEERMLSLLAFKRSLFAGVLDGGDAEVFLGGTRLSKFMESVEAVTVSAQEPLSAAAANKSGLGAKQRRRVAIESRSGAPHLSSASSVGSGDGNAAASGQPGNGGDRSQAGRAEEASAKAVDAWAPVLSAGLKLIQALASATHGGGGGGAELNRNEQQAARSLAVVTDAQTGRSFLKLPMPEPQALRQLTDALSRLIADLGR